MERIDAGASSYYGATTNAYMSQNHALVEWIFRAVYDEELLTQSHAIMWGGEKMAIQAGDHNAWLYLLLGDPDMNIRTKNPRAIEIRIPEYIAICKFHDLPIKVLNELGNPATDALVGLCKPAGWDLPNTEGETWVNGYTR
jgi:hypothetical protein